MTIMTSLTFLTYFTLCRIIIVNLVMVKTTFLIILLSLLALATTQVYQINLDLPPAQRYIQLSKMKSQSISNFITYLKTNIQKYKIAFATVSMLNAVSSQTLRMRVGEQFYDQCKSIAIGASLPISDIIVFNFMYELGAATDFCTAITFSYENTRLLGRNLDYGYQEYLANNSVHLKYLQGGVTILETLGHAGFIGTHTALKRATEKSPFQYAVTLNQRVEGGLHKTLLKIVSGKCESSPSALMRVLRQCSGSLEEVLKALNNANTCSAVYWTMISSEGKSYVIQKNRGVGSHKIREAENLQNVNFIVQTNHDSDEVDPDNRSTAARGKLISNINSQGVANEESIWQILTQQPNFNKLTLMTGVIDVQNGNISYKIWQ